MRTVCRECRRVTNDRHLDTEYVECGKCWTKRIQAEHEARVTRERNDTGPGSGWNGTA